ncbi:MAG: ATP-binding protein [Spirochaetales bacterium]|nr:ATP-binding protein [Spirochaetales bacterium]
MKKIDYSFDKITRGGFVLIALAIFTIGIFTYVLTSSFKSTNTHLENMIEVSLQSVAKEVNSWISEKRNALRGIGKRIGRLDNLSAKNVETYLKSTKEGQYDIIDIYFATIIPPSKGGYAVHSENWSFLNNIDWTTQEWFRKAIEEDHTIIIKPHKDEMTGKKIISISTPVYVGSDLYGVAGIDLSISLLNNISEKSFLEDVYINTIFDDGGEILETKKTGDINVDILTDNIDKTLNLLEENQTYIRTDFIKGTYKGYINIPTLDLTMAYCGPVTGIKKIQRDMIIYTILLTLLTIIVTISHYASWRNSKQLLSARKEIEAANSDLEKKIQDRTSSLKNILDNAEEGFFTFGESMVIDPDYSKGCEDIFGMNIAGLSVSEVLFPGMDEMVSDFKQGFKLYFEEKSKAKIIIDLTEKQTRIKNRNISLSYKETGEKKILCICNDITLKLEIDRKNRIEAENHKRILRAIHNKHFFAQFTESADTLFQTLELYIQQDPSKDEKKQLMRRIHTFKGDSGFFSFIQTQKTAHESETLITDSIHLDTAISYKEILIQIRKYYYKELKSISNTLGDNWIEESNGVSIPRKDFLTLIQYTKKTNPKDRKLQKFLDSFRKITLLDLFSRLPFAAEVTAEKLGKKILPMEIIGGRLKIVPDRFFPLAESCIHIVNNMVDHGIEYPFEREALQKTPEGKIRLTITVERNKMSLEFKDDGRGINPIAVEKKARSLGLIENNRSMQNSEIYALLLNDGFSTRETATDTSGRGVGLAAVNESVSKLGGSIEIRSKTGKGTTFELMVPLSNA